MRLEVRNLIKTYTIKNQDPVKALDDGTGNSIYIFTDDGQVISDTDTDTE